MTKYVARRLSPRNQKPRSNFDEYDDWQCGERVPIVELDPHEPQFTGLFDAKGHPLFRLPEKIGF